MNRTTTDKTRMMNHYFPAALKSTFLLGLLLLCAVPGFSAEPLEMADALRESGKIYVVVLVISTIFVGIILTLIYLDRRIKKLEKQNH